MLRLSSEGGGFRQLPVTEGGRLLFGPAGGAGGRDRGDAACPEEDGGRRDMDAC